MAPSSEVGHLRAFCLVGMGLAGFILAGNNLALEFGAENDRPMRIAATNSSAELVGGLSFLGAGLLADHAPLVWLFWLSIVLPPPCTAANIENRRSSMERGGAGRAIGELVKVFTCHGTLLAAYLSHHGGNQREEVPCPIFLTFRSYPLIRQNPSPSEGKAYTPIP